MKKRNTKKFLTKLTAVLIVALMLVPMIPLTANAAPTGYQDGDLLFSMDSLGGEVTYNYDPTSLIIEEPKLENATFDGDNTTKIVSTKAYTGNASGGVEVATNLPLNANTAYSIDFYAKTNYGSVGGGLFFGFAQNEFVAADVPAEGANIHVLGNGTVLNTVSNTGGNRYHNNSASSNSRWNQNLSYNIWTDRAGSDGFVKFTLTIDGPIMTLYADGKKVAREYDLSSSDKAGGSDNNVVKLFSEFTDKLSIQGGFSTVNQSGVNIPNGACVVEIKNISVYAGAAPYRDGDIILEMSAFDSGKVTYNPYGITVANGSNAKAARDTTDSTKINAGAAELNGGVSLNTSLPLNNDVAYTIEYEAKLNDRSNGLCLFAGFVGQASWCVNGINLGVYANGKNIKTVQGYTIDIYNRVGTTDTSGRTLPVNVWEECADADGFVKFVLTYDKGTLTMSVDGSNIEARFDVTNATKSGCYDTADISNLNLAFGYCKASNGDATTPTTGDHILSVKNIAIYAGVRTSVEVRDENGNVLDKVETFDGEGIAADELAAVDGEQVIWCNPHTGAVVDAPSGTYTRDTVLVAKSRALNASEVLGVQLGALDNGTRDIRIVAGMYNTEGTGVGFDVEIKYYKNEVLVTDKYRITGTSVFEAINATENGEITNHTANSLGANYLIALAVKDIDVSLSQIDFRVASFRTFDGSDARVYSEISEFSIVGGEVTTSATRLA